MRFIKLFIFFLLTSNAMAKPLAVEVLSVEFGVKDQLQQKSLCLTVMRISSSGKMIGVIEDIWDCFIARTAKKGRHQQFMLAVDQLSPLPSSLVNHLQRPGRPLEFYYSEGE